MYPTLNRMVLAKIEGTPGTDASPVPGSDAIRVENISGGPQLGSTQTNEVTSSLDADADIPNGAFGQLGFVMNLKGAGAGQATTPPECAVPLRACGFEAEVRAAAVTGTAQAGGANTITLAAGASSVDHFYAGLPITTTGGTGSGQTKYIVAYNGTTKVATVVAAFSPAPDATTTYSIPAGVRLKPRSAGLEAASLYDYAHRVDGGNSRLRKVVGGRGTWTGEMAVRQPCKFTFDFRGQVVEPTDVSPPAVPVYDQVTASPWLNAPTYFGNNQIALNTLRMDAGNNVILTDNPNTEMGYGIAYIVNRRATAGINPPKDLKSVLDPFTAWRDQVDNAFVTSWGASGGKRIQLTMPAFRINSVSDQDIQGLSHDQIDGRALGENRGIILYFY